MFTLTVLYPNQSDAGFDFDYYMSKHLPLAQSVWGTAMTNAEVIRGVPSPDGAEPPYKAISLIHFQSQEACLAALANPRTMEVMSDIAHFTSIVPTSLFGAIVAPSRSS